MKEMKQTIEMSGFAGWRYREGGIPSAFSGVTTLHFPSVC